MHLNYSLKRALKLYSVFLDKIILFQNFTIFFRVLSALRIYKNAPKSGAEMYLGQR